MLLHYTNNQQNASAAIDNQLCSANVELSTDITRLTAATPAFRLDTLFIDGTS